jgi:SOUL heme-binding protein
MTQRQEFRVIEKYSGFELREYLPCVIAEVKVSAPFSSASSAAFRSLFSYISKGNAASQKIAMTAPVIAATHENPHTTNEWFVSFVMPAGSNLSQLPNPNDSRVTLRDIPAQKCVAVSFRGRATEEKSAEIAAKLRTDAAKEEISLTDETRVCRFDPPFKPGFMQFNEIVIPIAQ